MAAAAGAADHASRANHAAALEVVGQHLARGVLQASGVGFAPEPMAARPSRTMEGGAALRRLLATGDSKPRKWFRGALRHSDVGTTLAALVRVAFRLHAGADYVDGELPPGASEADLVFVAARALTLPELHSAFSASGATHEFPSVPHGAAGGETRPVLPAATMQMPAAAAAAAGAAAAAAPRTPPSPDRLDPGMPNTSVYWLWEVTEGATSVIKKLIQLEVHGRLLAQRALKVITPRGYDAVAALTARRVASVVDVICLVVPVFSNRQLHDVGGGITVHKAVTLLFDTRVARVALPFVYHMLLLGRLAVVTPPMPRGMDSAEVLALRTSLHLGDAVHRIEERMGRLDERVGRLDERVGRLDERVGRLEERFEERMGRVEEQLRELVALMRGGSSGPPAAR
jgi:hypothetical protein